MNRAAKVAIVVAAAVVYVPVMAGILGGAVMLFWIFGRGMCDFNCGDSTTFPSVAIGVAVIVYVVGLIAGIRWILVPAPTRTVSPANHDPDAPSSRPLHPPEELIVAFLNLRALLAQPSNDFTWSSWKDADAALAEVDSIIAQLRAGVRLDPTDLSVIFAPTGPAQEVSISSGWGEAFIAVADQFDAAFVVYRRTT
jgi:hypothetical protein